LDLKSVEKILAAHNKQLQNLLALDRLEALIPPETRSQGAVSALP